MPVRRLFSLLVVALASANCLASAVRPGVASFRGAGIGHSGARANARCGLRRCATPEFAAMLHRTLKHRLRGLGASGAFSHSESVAHFAEPSTRVSVSFIIGTDGRVHSALILESAGPAEDRTILDTVRSWRYRPAMCNGAATETEAKIEFSSR